MNKHSFSKWGVILLVFALVFGMLPLGIFAPGAALAADFDGGNGRADSPYLISTAAQLDAVRDGLSLHYKLANDIDLTAYCAVGGAGWNGGEGWMSIGTSSSGFTGNFDGAGFAIKGIFIDRFSIEQGLFGYIGSGGTVKNLSMKDGSIKRGGYSVGGVAGMNSGTITNCYWNMGAYLDDGVGGGFGSFTGGGRTTEQMMQKATFSGWDFTNVWYINEGKGNPKLRALLNFGGGAGTEQEPYLIYTPAQLDAVRNALSMHYKLANDIDLTAYCAEGGAGWNGGEGWMPIGDFSGDFNGAGHVIRGIFINRWYDGGLFRDINAGGTLRNLGLASGSITGSGKVGSLASSNSGTIANCYNAAAVSGSSFYTGGIVGQNFAGGIIMSCYNLGSVSGRGYGYVGGLVGTSGSGSTLSNSYNVGKVSDGRDVGGLVGQGDRHAISNCYWNTDANVGSIGLEWTYFPSGDISSGKTLAQMCTAEFAEELNAGPDGEGKWAQNANKQRGLPYLGGVTPAEFNPAPVLKLGEGQPASLRVKKGSFATIALDSNYDPSNLIFTCGSTAVKVDASGNVIGLKAGIAIVVVRSIDGKTAVSIVVTVV